MIPRCDLAANRSASSCACDSGSMATANDSSNSDLEYSSGPDEEEAGPDSHVPFEQLLQQRQQGPKPLSARSVREARETEPGSPGAAAAKATRKQFKRESKNRPVEQTSKRPVPRFREVIPVHKSGRDPRFDDLTGTLDQDRFKSAYAFLYNEQLPEERQELRQELRKASDEPSQARLRTKLSRVEQQIKLEEQRRAEKAVQRERKAKEREAVAAGKKPYFPKRSELKRQQLVAKFQRLKETGALEKYMLKRRRKTAAKDHKLVPEGRR